MCLRQVFRLGEDHRRQRFPIVNLFVQSSGGMARNVANTRLTSHPLQPILRYSGRERGYLTFLYKRFNARSENGIKYRGRNFMNELFVIPDYKM